MRFFVAVVVIIAIVMGAWWLTLSSPSSNSKSDLAVQNRPRVQEMEPTSTPAVQDKQVQRAATATDETTEQSSLALALQRYPNVDVQDLQQLFANDPDLFNIRTDFLLALIERGDIAPNQVVMSAPGMGPLTTAMYVVANARNSLTVAQFDRLVALGADINSSETWRTVMAMETNPKVIDKWYVHASAGPEMHEELYNKALALGNPSLRDYLLEAKGGKQSDLKIEPLTKVMTMGIVRGTVQNLSELDAELSSSNDFNRQVGRQEAAYLLQMRVRQAQMLQALTEDTKELEELKDLEQQLIEKVGELSRQHQQNLEGNVLKGR